MKIYLASPLGFNEPGRHYYINLFMPAIIALGHTVLDPWTLTDSTLVGRVAKMPFGGRKRAAWRRVNVLIGRNNVQAIDQCDAIIAVLDGPDVDSGTASEIGYGAGKGKLIVGYRSDFRFSGDNEGSVVNLQVEFFVQSSGGTIVTSLVELKKELTRLSRGRSNSKR